MACITVIIQYKNDSWNEESCTITQTNEASEQGHPLKIYIIGMSLYTWENAKIVNVVSTPIFTCTILF